MMDDIAGAIDDLTTAIELYSQSSKASTQRGKAHRDRGELDAAGAERDRARNVDAQSGLAYYDRSVAYGAAQNSSAANQRTPSKTFG